jgi:flagellar biosynthesis/type III secretory pathway protein FliH
MDFAAETAKLEEIIKRYRMQFHQGNTASIETLAEWRQATHMALERAYTEGYDVGVDAGKTELAVTFVEAHKGEWSKRYD